MKSHIQMPKLILKNFTDCVHSLYYYDFENNKFGKCNPRSFYTEMDYYSQDIEVFLSNEIECKFGRVVRFIKDTPLCEGIRIPIEYEDISRNYVISLLGRSPFLLEQVKKSSVFFQFLPMQDQHDYAVMEGYAVVKEQGTFEKCSVAIMENKSQEEFILPTGGIIQYNNCLVCPIMPTKAIVIGYDTFGEIDNDLYMPFLSVNDSHIVRKINIEAYRQEMNRDRKYIVSTQKELLESIVEEYSVKSTG